MEDFTQTKVFAWICLIILLVNYTSYVASYRMFKIYVQMHVQFRGIRSTGPTGAETPPQIYFHMRNYSQDHVTVL